MGIIQSNFLDGKVCSKCHLWKPSDEFWRLKGKYLGRHTWGKTCIRNYRSRTGITEKWYERNGEEQRRKQRNNRIENLKFRKQRKRKNLSRYKRETFERYGGARCAVCGVDDLDILTIDHIDGIGGGEHRKRKNMSGTGIYTWLKKQGYPSGYRVLCFSHNLKDACVRRRKNL